MPVVVLGVNLAEHELARFRSRITVGPGCHEWVGGDLNSKGYGRFCVYRSRRRVRLLSHRLALALALGRNPEGETRHRCDNPLCCRPDHLLEGSHQANMQDASERGRVFDGLAAYRAERDRRAAVRLAAGIKVCSRCKLTKPLAAFSLQRRNFDGRQSECKSCSSDRYRERKGVS